MRAFLIPHYKFVIPSYVCDEPLYNFYKSQILNGGKIDIYRKPSYKESLSPQLLGFTIIAGINLLLWIKVSFLPTDGARQLLDFFSTLTGFSIVYVVCLIISFSHLQAKINNYNKRVKKLIIKSDTFQEFTKEYHHRFCK